MRKYRLELDELSVESFDVLPETSEQRGTVRGREATPILGTCFGCGSATVDGETCVSCDGCGPGTHFNTCEYTCDDATCATCGNSCAATCGASCWDTCGRTCNCVG